MTLEEYKHLRKDRIAQGEKELAEEEIHCHCGKLLARQTKSGKILVWCKSCRKEVELGVEPYEPDKVQR